MKFFYPIFLILISCSGIKKIPIPDRRSSLSGSAFYDQVAAYDWMHRDSLIVKEILDGNIPSFLKRFHRVDVSYFDSASRKIYRASYYVAPDYLSLGTDQDWARIHITPNAAQKIADQLNCFLPTRKMVDDIYKAATIKLEPIPLYAFRDSSPVMYHHHLIIEGQRKNRKGLIAGIKKDVVISGKVSRDNRSNRVAIYGWHKLNGEPIQPLYTGHVNWYVDYSQGIRLVYRKIKVNGQWMDYQEVLDHPILRRLICDEEYCDFHRYSY